MNLQQLLDRRDELNQELAFYDACRDDFTMAEYFAETDRIVTERRDIQNQISQIRRDESQQEFEAGIAQANQNLINSFSQIDEYVAEQVELEANTVDVDAEAIDDGLFLAEANDVEVLDAEANDDRIFSDDGDDWLIDEFNAICDDPQGDRFATNSPRTHEEARIAPVFASYLDWVLWITGQVWRLVSALRGSSSVNQLICTGSMVA